MSSDILSEEEFERYVHDSLGRYDVPPDFDRRIIAHDRALRAELDDALGRANAHDFDWREREQLVAERNRYFAALAEISTLPLDRVAAHSDKASQLARAALASPDPDHEEGYDPLAGGDAFPISDPGGASDG